MRSIVSGLRRDYVRIVCKFEKLYRTINSKELVVHIVSAIKVLALPTGSDH